MGYAATLKHLITYYLTYVVMLVLILTKEEILKLHAEYLSGMSIPELGIKYNLVTTSIQRWFKKNNLPLKSKEQKNLEKSIKTKKTVLERYGVENVGNAFRDKMRSTMLERYGAAHPAHVQEIWDRKQKTVLERYGSEYLFQTEKFKADVKRYNLDVYGVEFNSQVPHFKFKSAQGKISARKNRLATYLRDNGYDLLEAYEGNRMSDAEGKHIAWRTYNIRHKCGNVFVDDVFMTPRCPKCYPLNKSVQEIAYADYIRSLGFEVLSGDRNVIKPFELDMYLPKEKIAFEYNGVFYHRLKKDCVKKTDLAQEAGVKVYHIWEFQNVEIVKSRICSVLGIYQERIDARKTKFEVISSAEGRAFCLANHLQGEAKSFLYCGLKRNNELLAVVCFRTLRGLIDIARFCVKKHTLIRGGFSKLLKNSLPLLPPGDIQTYADRDWTPAWEDSVYVKAGFSFEHDAGPMLSFYAKKERRWYPRQNYQLHKIKDLVAKHRGQGLSAEKMLEKADIMAIWNSGNFRFKLTRGSSND